MCGILAAMSPFVIFYYSVPSPSDGSPAPAAVSYGKDEHDAKARFLASHKNVVVVGVLSRATLSHCLNMLDHAQPEESPVG